MKARVEEAAGSFEEAVTVNQRGLIDKILARYSTELTLFRELLQNANDARAKNLQIRFSGTGFWQTVRAAVPEKAAEKGAAQQETRHKADLSFTGLRICNDGSVFEAQDWKRIKSIADGNPDETKVGFFGVGFYSVFSLSDEPTVLSGDKALSFFWKKDALFVTHGKVPESADGEKSEDATALKMVREGWTVFDLPVRKDPPFPTLPDPQHMAEFLVRCLTFTTTLESVQVFYDGSMALTVGRKVTGKPAVVEAPEKATIADPRGLFRFARAHVEPLLYSVQRFDQAEPVLIQMKRVQSTFAVSVDSSFAAAMHRVTKKNPPKSVQMQLLFDVSSDAFSSQGQGQSLAGLESFSPASAKGGFFFIGSGITQQSTGTKCHCQGPFMPTMERNAMDFSDVTLATWNRSLLWVVGALQRLSFEGQCAAVQAALLQQKLQQERRQQQAVQQAAPAQAQAQAQAAAHAAAHAAAIAEAEQEEARVRADFAEQQKRLVHTAMATFALKRTTPVEQVGELVSAGFYSSMETAPMVWTSAGPRRASEARLKDQTGLHELVKQTVSIVVLPDEPRAVGDSESAADLVAKKAKSAFGFFASLLGSSPEGAKNDGASGGEQATDTLGSLCRQFVEILRKRQVLRDLDVRDLMDELGARPLEGNAEAVLMLRWLIKREQTLKSMRQRQQRQSAKEKQEKVTCHCDWCGKGVIVRVDDLRREQAKAERAQKEQQGLFSRMLGSAGTEAVNVKLRCPGCGQVTFVNPAKITSSSLSGLELSSAYSNRAVLAKARLGGSELIRFRSFLSKHMVKRIDSSSDKGMPDKLHALLRRSDVVVSRVMPLDISGEFKDADLIALVKGWLSPVTWCDWAAYCGSLLGKLSPPLAESDMALASNVLRVVAFAYQHGDIFGDDRKAMVLSSMASRACVPVATRELKKPFETYLGKEATGGFTTLPVVVVCEALEDGSFAVHKEAPKDAAVVAFLKQLGVKTHVDLGYVFDEFNRGSLGWNRQEILHYIASMRSSLDNAEIQRLTKLAFLPALEVRDGGGSYPSTTSYRAAELHFPDPRLLGLRVPMVYAILEEGLPVSTAGTSAGTPQARTFFDAHADTVSPTAAQLLTTLGVSRRPMLDTVIQRASAPETHAAALAYLVANFEYYRESYRPLNSRVFIPCTHGGLESPLNCYTNPKAALLGRPCVDGSRIRLKDAALLGVREHVPAAEVVLALSKRAGLTPEEAPEVLEYLGSLLPSMSNAALRKLGGVPFVPVTTSSSGKTGGPAAAVEHHAPRHMFFRPSKNKPGNYEGLFPYVFFESDKATMFLRAVGTRSEPTVDELAMELTTGSNAADHFARVGAERYLHLLQLLAVEHSTLSQATCDAMRAKACVLALHSTQPPEDKQAAPAGASSSEENAEENAEDLEHVDYKLARPRDVYIVDDEVMNRLFNPPMAPQESTLENLYRMLGSPQLSHAVTAETKASRPFTVTEETKAFERALRRRAQLFYFKRAKSHFTREASTWMQLISNKSQHFVLEVPSIQRTLILNGVQKRRPCSACTVPGRTPVLAVTKGFTEYDAAAELCRVFLHKSTLHDNLLWSTIIKSSDEQLRDQGFPVKRTFVAAAPKPAAPKPAAPKPAAPEPAAPKPALEDGGSKAVVPAPPSAPGTPPKPPQPPPPSQPQQPPPKTRGPTAPDVGEAAYKAPKRKSSLGGGLMQMLSKAKAMQSSSKPQPPKDKSKLTESMYEAANKQSSLHDMQREMMKHAAAAANAVGAARAASQPAPAPAPPAGGGQTQPGGQKQGGEHSSLMVDREARKRAMMQGLRKCHGGAGEAQITSEAAQVPMVSVMDDLHEHNLVNTGFKVCGLECFVEQGADASHSVEELAQAYRDYGVQSMAFAQLLIGLATNVFGVEPGVCHLYYHFNGSTAAFNRGGALYFNLSVFLSQLTSAAWEIKPVMGRNKQPQFLCPTDAILEWFGVFAHELAHNHVHQHDAAFANWMMMYCTGFFTLLFGFVEQTENAERTGQAPP